MQAQVYAPDAGRCWQVPTWACWAVALLLGLSSVLYDTAVYQTSDLPKETALWVGISLIVALMSGYITLFRITRFELPLSLGTCIPLFLLLMGAISIGWAENHHLASLHVQKWSITLLLFYFIIAGRLDKRKLGILLAGFTLGVTANALVGLYQVWTGYLPEWIVIGPGGTFLNKNVAAQATVLAFSLAFGATIFATRRCFVSTAWVCSLVLATFLFHTFTRAAWLAALCALGLMFITICLRANVREAFRLGMSRARLITTGLWVLLFCLGANLGSHGWQWGFGQALNDITTGNPEGIAVADTDKTSPGSEGGTRAMRMAMWRNALVMLTESGPFGVGEGNFQVEFPPYANAVVLTSFDTNQRYLRYLHNEYLEFVIEFGIPGVICVLLFCASLAYASLRAVHSEDTSRSVLALVVCSGLLALGVNAMFSSPLYWPIPRFAFALLAGCIFTIAPMKRYTWQLPWGRLVGGTALLLALLLAYTGAARYVRELAGQTAFHEAQDYYARQDIAMAFKQSALATKLIPHDQQLRMFYGAMLLTEGYDEGALEQMDALADDHPYDVRNNMNRSIALERLGFTDELAETYEDILLVLPYDQATAHRLAALYREQGKREKADAVLARLADAEARLKPE